MAKNQISKLHLQKLQLFLLEASRAYSLQICVRFNSIGAFFGQLCMYAAFVCQFVSTDNLICWQMSGSTVTGAI